MQTKSPYPFESFQWSPHAAAFRFLRGLSEDFLAALPEAAVFAERVRTETGTRFIDWIDHLCLNRADGRVSQIEGAGYRIERTGAPGNVFVNDTGMFPPAVIWDGTAEVGIKVESVADFLAANRLGRDVHGSPPAMLRTCRIFAARECALTAVERHGTRDFGAGGQEGGSMVKRSAHLEEFRARPRSFENDEAGFDAANRLIDAAIRDLGRDLTCDLWFAAEREYWMRRNSAARAQKARQDRLGLGWANHDHHTYRSSRRNFQILIATWEKLGLQCRERFYAGREAGWGAQVMEQPVTGIVTFNDVDLAPNELVGDFGHDGLDDKNNLGTVGLWCGLHGDSFLQAGMHHLAVLSDFNAISKQLAEESGVKIMKPFSDFPYLRQAFTEGERWKVNPERIERLRAMRLITVQQAEQFCAQGAVGSHLETIERNDGFKGFDQAGVNEIIHATDPRKSIGA